MVRSTSARRGASWVSKGGARPIDVGTDAATLFFALLAVAAEVGVLALVAAGVASWGRGTAADLGRQFLDAVGPHAFALALLVAAVASAGSLYLSEVAHFPPCRLCWYQRLTMYPLVPLLALGVWTGRQAVRWLAFALASAGAAISAWHVLVERYPSLETGACDPTNPCSIIWVERFGYLTIPTMALSGFVLIATLMVVARRDALDQEL